MAQGQQYIINREFVIIVYNYTYSKHFSYCMVYIYRTVKHYDVRCRNKNRR